MPITHEWLVPARITLTRLVGTVTTYELVAAADEGNAMLDRAQPPVYRLIDVTGLTGFPLQLQELRAVSFASNNDKPQWIILFGIDNPFMNFLATSFAHFWRGQLKVVADRDEALRLIDRLEGVALVGYDQP